MKFNKKYPPRKFTVGQDNQITISDCGTIKLKPNEQVTFIADNSKEYDVVRKDWGFYATPSINKRLKNFGLKTALVKNDKNNFFIMLVEKNLVKIFNQYIKSEKMEIVEWLDER